jgi:spore coat polysaccharide biosynthesis protein SpsF
LPEKCLLPFGDATVLHHIIRRARHYAIDPIVCTSTDPRDDAIETIARSEDVRCFRGSLRNKLKRWSDCAESFGVDRFHTVDADDPFFDGEEMHRSMQLLAEKRLDMVSPTEASSAGGASVGYSLTADVVRRASAGQPDDLDTEMMWFHVAKISGLRAETLAPAFEAPGQLRLTLDYPEDYWLLESVRRMVGNLARRSEVNALFSRNPDLYLVNWFRNGEWKAAQQARKV